MKPRLLTIVSVVYLLLILYASVMPFDLVASGDEARAAFDHAWEFWPFGQVRRTSRTDVLSNFLLYVPLGFLLATRWRLGRAIPAWLGLPAAAAVSSAVSLSVEGCQLFSLHRVASAQDFLINTCGGGLGSVIGTALGPTIWNGLLTSFIRRWRRRPMVLAAGAMAVLLAIDGLYPLVPTLDVGTVWGHLRSSQWLIGEAVAAKPWHHWVVNRVGVYAVLTVLLAAASLRVGWQRWLGAAELATCLAIAIEFAKPFIISRWANVANILFAAVGSAVGMAVGPALAGRLSARRKVVLATILLTGYVVYHALSPFRFSIDARSLAEKVPRGTEWLPLYHYAMGSRFEDIRLFVRTLVLLGALSFCWNLRGGRLARGPLQRRMITSAGAAGLLGLVLECGQFFLPGRVPSATDVFCFALGGAIGAWVSVRWEAAEAARKRAEAEGPCLPPADKR